MLVSAKLAPTFPYEDMVAFWRDADELGFHAIWNYDHFYGLGGNISEMSTPTLEGWTTLAAMATLTTRARIGCMVTGVTYRHPAVLANMAATVDHISAGRLELGIGAAWHEPEHRGLGIDFPGAGARVDRLDEALEVIKLLFTEEKPSFDGKHFRLEEALFLPKTVQRPRPPIVVGASKPKMLALTAKHADEWNTPSFDPAVWGDLNEALTKACSEIGRDPASLRRSAQIFIHPAQEGQPELEISRMPEYEARGCEHVVLSFYQPPGRALLEKLASL